MAHRITVESRSDYAKAGRICKILSERFPQSSLSAVSFVQAYTVDASLSKLELEKARAVLTNPVIDESSSTYVRSPDTFSYALEIGFHAGVTDNVGSTARQMVMDALGRTFKDTESVYSSVFVFLKGKVTKAQAEAMAGELHNALIERVRILSFKDWNSGRIPLVTPKVRLKKPAPARSVNLMVSDEELTRIGKEGILAPDGTRRGPLALSLVELYAIRDYFKKQKRPPLDIELEALAQTWSEHCKHTIFSDPLDDVSEGIYKRYIKGATEKIRKAKGKKDFCVSVFKDNSGGIVFNNEYLVTHKMETHNTPSALDPYGGAITGIVGVNRDAIGFGLGAKPIANLFGFCVGEPTDKRTLYRDKERTRALLSPRRILAGVVKGIEAGGNQSGIPTPLGFVYADESYRGKPLVFAGTVGLIPRKRGGRLLHQKAARAGDLIVVFGGRVGLDGIHGATFSSEALTSGSPATAVQIGDPITQKKFSDAIVRELRDKNLYTSITDNGAGGLSCSVAEMANECGGCVVDLSTVPLKYAGLEPWQIWISESQERMTASVPKGNWKELKSILEKHGVEATVIGKFTASGSCVVQYDGKKIMDMKLSFLHDGRPKKQLSIQAPVVETKALPLNRLTPKQTLLALLKRPNIGSYASISEQYDHEVQGMSVTKPLVGRGRVNADAAVIRPLRTDTKGVVLAHGYAPSWSEMDGYRMAAASIDTAVRNAVCAGAPLNHLAILDNFCWSSSNTPERLYILKEAARAVYDYAVAYGTPYISGKDSMYNDFRGYDEKGASVHVAALPTLLISAIGVMKNVSKAMTFDVKSAGDVVYLLGTTTPKFGGSEYAKLVAGTYLADVVPSTDAKENLKVYRVVEKLIGARLVSAALGVSRGGAAVAAAKMALAGGLGMELSLTGDSTAQLFSESQGRILVTVPKAKVKVFEALVRGISAKRIGAVVDTPTLVIKTKGAPAIEATLAELTKAYGTPYAQF